MKVTTTPLFERQLIINSFNHSFIKDIEQILNIKTINTWSLKKTHANLSIEYEQEFIAYRFLILKQWINLNESYSNEYINDLENMILILDLDKYLTSQEKNYIKHFRAVVFAKNRNIKNIIVDFSLLNNEEVWYLYDLETFNQKINNCYLLLQSRANLYLSNQRIIIAKGNEYHSIYWKDITSCKIEYNMLVIRTKYSEFIFISYDLHMIYVSIERIGKLIKIKI